MLGELKFFKKINFVFLIVGHTKNACDRMFNTLKKDYNIKNIYTMAELVPILNRSKRVTVCEAREEDFFDYGTFLNLF